MKYPSYMQNITKYLSQNLETIIMKIQDNKETLSELNYNSVILINVLTSIRRYNINYDFEIANYYYIAMKLIEYESNDDIYRRQIHYYGWCILNCYCVLPNINPNIKKNLLEKLNLIVLEQKKTNKSLNDISLHIYIYTRIINTM